MADPGPLLPLLPDAERGGPAPAPVPAPALQFARRRFGGRDPASAGAKLAAVLMIGSLVACSAFVVLICVSQWRSVYDGGNASVLQQQPGSGWATELQDQKPRVVEADHGMVAADDVRCSRVGRDVLKDGGNAIDAAVATTLCLGVVSPESSGLGGGAFMLVRLATGQAIAYDMRETAPAAASENMYDEDLNAKSVGALSVGTPGELAGLHLAWERHGRLPWRRLVLPAARIAGAGFQVTAYLAAKILSNSEVILGNPGLAEFLVRNGTVLGTGDVCYRPKLAKTLELVARLGPSVFYRGSIGAAIVKDVRAAGGILTRKDLAEYQVKVRKPVYAEVMGHSVLGMPPPSSGGAGLILILNILASYKSPADVLGTLGLHRLVEAFKHTYAIRMNIGDPDFVDVTNVLNDMLSSKFASQLREQIVDNTTFAAEYYGGSWNQLTDHGTSHFGIVDAERNAVSVTSTVNDVFGSLLMSPSTGILLNNEMDDFAAPTDIAPDKLPPAVANFVRPNKRPLSAMAPTIIVKDGQVKGVFGASGGSKIITAIAQVILNLLVKGMDPLSSVLSPRVHHQLVPNVVQYENWTLVTGDHIELSGNYIEALKDRGHELVSKSSGAIVQVVVQDLNTIVEPLQDRPVGKGLVYGKLIGVSDLRKDGVPAGF